MPHSKTFHAPTDPDAIFRRSTSIDTAIMIAARKDCALIEDEVAGLISRVALGDRLAFARLYTHTSPKLFGVCLRILRDRTDAEEALQEIYIRVWQRAKSFGRAAGTGNSWLVSIARNHSIDLIRARKRPTEDIDDRTDIADESVPNPETAMAWKDEGRRIDECMGRLPSAQSRAVKQAYVEGLSYVELAELFSVPLSTIRMWLRRGLLKLKECMESHG